MSRTRSEEPLWLKRTPEGFVPAAALDRLIIDRFGVGSVVKAVLTKPRSGKQQRFYWAIVRRIWGHQEVFPTPEALDHWLTIKLGYIDRIEIGNEVHLIPQSKNYDSMEQGEFNEFVNRVFQLIWGEVLPGMNADGRREMLAEVDQMVR